MCEDFPCCGHENGDCEGRLYGSDADIFDREMARLRNTDDWDY